MAANYIGYGINTNDLDNEQLVKFIHDYAPEDYAELLAQTKEDYPDEYAENPEEAIAANVSDFIDSVSSYTAEYIRDVINEHEKKEHDVSDVTEAYDQYLVFGAIAFINDCPERANYIKSDDDFKAMMRKYFDLRDKKFGSVYEGSEWGDPVYWRENE